ncbi:MAG TPA: di-heme oxidoredictase family protein [Methylibium sp.]|nr:di-heme oxidoredictase family protein [Methylibium sp.]
MTQKKTSAVALAEPGRISGHRLAAKLIASVLGTALIALVAGTALAQFDATPHTKRPKAKHTTLPPRPLLGAGPQFGAPLPDLEAAQAAAFEAGREEFESAETADGGLGPIFNGVSCVACHSAPAAGGAGASTVTRFGRLTHGRFDPLTQAGGSLLQRLAIDPAAQEQVPGDADVVALRLTTPLFGAGLIEAIPDSEIRQNAARRKPDGIAGRAATIVDIASGQWRVGRFGWKAQHASLLSFAADAYLNEMGVTNRFFPVENAPNGNVALVDRFDSVPDPEDTLDPATGRGDVDALADFMRLLAPPPQPRQTPSAATGARLFEQMNCAACHTPFLLTGASPVAALAHQPVPLFSDLLLHDMGALGDGIVQGAARAREMRTPPLWGLRARGPFLHDGRAATVDAAIRAHDGEGAAARDRYNRLGRVERQQVLDFLNSI